MKTIRQKLIVSICVVLISCLPAFSQSNDHIDELLIQPQALLGSTAYIVLSAGKIIDESVDVAAAFDKAREMGIIPASATAETPVRVDQLSFMLMKSLSLKGGVMYSLFPGSRYAYKEMVYKKVVNGTGGPGRIVSGDEVLRSLTNALDLNGGQK